MGEKVSASTDEWDIRRLLAMVQGERLHRRLHDQKLHGSRRKQLTKEETTINELDKAKAVVTDKNNSFEKLKKGSGVSIPTLKAYRANPEKLKTARWSTVHKLAQLYDAKH